MPRFALLDADNRVVNIVALARKEDFTEVVHLGHGHEADAACGLGHEVIGDAEHRKDPKYGEPVVVETSDHHLVAHGAVTLVDAHLSTKIGMEWRNGAFAWPPEPQQPLPSTLILATK